MLYKINCDVPANTAIAAPDWQKLKMSKGTIIEWIIVTPLECANLMQFWVEYHGVQILPFSRGERIWGLSWPTVIKDNIKIDSPPYELDVYASNTDTVKNHEYNIYCNIEPATAVIPGDETAGLWDKIKGFIGGEE